jgi:hypothetical protein
VSSAVVDCFSRLLKMLQGRSMGGESHFRQLSEEI